MVVLVLNETTASFHTALARAERYSKQIKNKKRVVGLTGNGILATLIPGLGSNGTQAS